MSDLALQNIPEPTKAALIQLIHEMAAAHRSYLHYSDTIQHWDHGAGQGLAQAPHTLVQTPLRWLMQADLIQEGLKS